MSSRDYSEDRELLAYALVQALSEQYESELAECKTKIECPPEHYREMSKILGFKVEDPNKKKWFTRPRRMVAAILAAVLLLTGCTAIVFRKQISSFVEHFYETYIKVMFDDDEGEPRGSNGVIEEFYSLSYVPEGYELSNKTVNSAIVYYEWANSNAETISFRQLADSSGRVLDSEQSNSKILEYSSYEIYYRNGEQGHSYIWKNDKYSFMLTSSVAIDEGDLKKIIDGMAIAE